MREDAIWPNNQTRHGQLPHQESANCHIKNRPTATSRIGQLPHQESANCHIKNRPTATFVVKKVAEFEI
jgi:hypothetical protein